jgi:hypothetical protein
MRFISAGIIEKETSVVVLDDPGAGGACHEYRVYAEGASAVDLARVKFQKGPILEGGVNGCQNEDLLAIVIDRLQGFQGGEFACRENAIALTKLEEVLMWLNKRTADRRNRGVEGRNEL